MVRSSLRWLIVVVGLAGCSSEHAVAPQASRDAGVARDAASLDASTPADPAPVHEAGANRADASGAADASVHERALTDVVRLRVVVSATAVCALDAARDVVCWGAAQFANPMMREEHTPLHGPYDAIDMMVGFPTQSVCGMHADAGVDCAIWNEQGTPFSPFTAYTRDDHDVTFSLERQGGNLLLAVDTDGGVTSVLDGTGHRPALNTGHRAVQVQDGLQQDCVRDETGYLACSYYNEDGGAPLVQPAPTDTYRDFAVGEFDACGITTANRLRCWAMFQGEADAAKQFPDFVSKQGSTPRMVTTGNHDNSGEICVLTVNGRVACGDNVLFEGNVLRLDPVPTAVEIAVGEEAICYVFADDTLRCMPRADSCAGGACPDLDERYRVPDGLTLAPL